MNNNITTALLSLLNKGIVSFTYRKVNGEIRKAIGSRNLDSVRRNFGIYVPAPKTGNSNPTAYYDITSEGWRSFKAENVLSINGIDIKDIKGISGSDIVKVNEPTEVEIPINIGAFRNGLAIPFGDLDKEIEIKPTAPKSAPKGNGVVLTPVGMEKDHIALPISEMSIEDFAKIVAKYVVDEFVSRMK